MKKLRLIDSFTWMMLNIEWYLLEQMQEETSIKILEMHRNKEIGKYLGLISNINNLDTSNYIEALDYLLNMDKDKQLKLNKQILSLYQEKDVIELLKDTVDLLSLIEETK